MRIGSGQILGGRAEQQDYFSTFERGGTSFLVLADGIGGLVGGGVASAVAVKAFKASLEGEEDLADVSRSLERALECANEAIARAGERDARLRGMGTTLAALAVDERTVRWISVGDSVILRLRSGSAARLNRAHTRLMQLHDQVARGELTAAEAESDPQGESITSALRGTAIPEIDRGEERLWESDGFAVASDGVLSIGLSRLQRALAAELPPQTLVDRLLEAIERAAVPGQDNCTLLLAASGAFHPEESGDFPAAPRTTVIASGADRTAAGRITSGGAGANDTLRRHWPWFVVAALLLMLVSVLAWLAFGTRAPLAEASVTVSFDTVSAAEDADRSPSPLSTVPDHPREFHR